MPVPDNTGEMLDQVLDIFDICPDYDLNIGEAGQDLYDVTSRVLTGMRDVLKEARPDVVLVHGDTTTYCRCSVGLLPTDSGSTHRVQDYVHITSIAHGRRR